MAMAQQSMSVGIVAERRPGVTRWARHAWKITAVLPGAGPADWRELRRDGEIVSFHVATLPLTLWQSDTESYLTALKSRQPGVVVVLSETDDAEARLPWVPHLVTASPYEGQDYMDSGEGLIEQVPMPPGLIAWVQDFCDRYHEETPFVKRRRDRKRVDLVEDGKGDPRIRQVSDVYRAPARGVTP